MGSYGTGALASGIVGGIRDHDREVERREDRETSRRRQALDTSIMEGRAADESRVRERQRAIEDDPRLRDTTKMLMSIQN